MKGSGLNCSDGVCYEGEFSEGLWLKSLLTER